MTNAQSARRTSTKRPAASPKSTEPTRADSSPLFQMGASGGHGGAPFLQAAPPEAQLLGVEVRHAGMIDAVGLIWSLDAANSDAVAGEPEMAGGSGGETDRLTLEPGETLTRISGRCGLHVDSLVLTTSLGRTLTFGGDGGESEFRYDLPPGTELAGLFGRAGVYLDALGILLRPVEPGAGQPSKPAATPRKSRAALGEAAAAPVGPPEEKAKTPRKPGRKTAAASTPVPETEPPAAKPAVKRPRKPKASQE